MIILDEKQRPINHLKMERAEQLLAQQYILKDDIVLELGGRYGSVSCTINPLLNNPNNHVVVEPDDRVWDCLEINKQNNNCHFHIVKGCISTKQMTRYYPLSGKPHPGQYATGFMIDDNGNTPIYSLSTIIAKYNLSHFTVLIADCEGCFPMFLLDNLTILQQLRLIILEKDIPKNANYNESDQILLQNHFKQIDFKKPHHYVYLKY